MSWFKDQIKNDIDTFINLDEFAEEHRIEGKHLKCVVDEDEFRQRARGSEYATAESGLTIYVRTEDIQHRKSPLSALNVDGREYTVINWESTMGVETIDLVQGIMA